MGSEHGTALISGGLGDIGSAIAVQFGQRGTRVAISDLVEADEAESRLEALRTKGCAELLYRKVDVSSADEVSDWLDSVEEIWGTAQLVVPNAGIVVSGSLVGRGLALEPVHRQIDVNFWGSYYLAVQAAERMKAVGLPGRITFIGSWAAERPNARIPAYCISKAAIRMLCRTMALELAADDILVNEIAPGIVDGGLSRQNQRKDPELLKQHLESIPRHRLVSVEEIARQVLRLSDFEDLNVTGTTLVVDGGLSLTSRMTR